MADDSMLGSSPAMKMLKSAIGTVARVIDSVLITGETGVGKELVATAIHEHESSQTKEYSLVSCNCAAFPKELVETELFGYKKGAFTGADGDRDGMILKANSSTLFLDEIGEMSLDVQAKLLRVLQQRKVVPVGGTDPTDAECVSLRVVAATNVNLDQEVASGRFREDLLYRLDVHRIYVPPLRNRKEDIPKLVTGFAKRHKERNDYEKPIDFSAEVLERFKTDDYSWHGNVRELENMVSRVIVRVLKDGRSPEIDDVAEVMTTWAKPAQRLRPAVYEDPTGRSRAGSRRAARVPDYAEPDATMVDSETRMPNSGIGFREWLRRGWFDRIVKQLKVPDQEFGDVIDEFAMALIHEAENRVPKGAIKLLGLNADRRRKYIEKNGVMHTGLHKQKGVRGG